MYAFIGDLHIGVKLPNEDYMKSLELFLQHIRKHKEPCHAIFVVGDLFDHRLSVNEFQFTGQFIVRLVCNQCGRNNRQHVPVYFIHGTYSHDLDQYDVFMPFLTRMTNVEVFYCKTHTAFELRNGIRVLGIPHESGDIDYTNDFNQTYDLIVGHGVIVDGLRNPCKASGGIIHSAKQLGDISKLCVFGHYHGYTDFGNGVYYTGPWLRWRYGEDEDRVFFFCNDKFEVETIPNPIALPYTTIHITSVDELRDYVANDIHSPHRFIFDQVKPDELEIVKSIALSTKVNPNVTYEFGEIITDDTPTVDEVVSTITTEQPIPALVSYIKEKYDIDAGEKLSEYETQINKDKTE